MWPVSRIAHFTWRNLNVLQSSSVKPRALRAPVEAWPRTFLNYEPTGTTRIAGTKETEPSVNVPRATISRSPTPTTLDCPTSTLTADIEPLLVLRSRSHTYGSESNTSSLFCSQVHCSCYSQD
ncbi:hypothetical protein FQA47_020296 [Oryzias melastigma]|uniref:Uncharacterized protein n=1 Tax=Oryzias melastigma TaxID=30732 RepID=A0A834FKN8_ORYME|nr:hypothetical protein FQA47_020296 [Oryzias melastigma]